MNANKKDYRLPFPALQQYLGTPSATPERNGSERKSIERVWPCGCTARFRDSLEQTAAWRPCSMHRSGSARAPEAPAERRSERADDVLPTVDSFLARRVAPRFCIVDPHLNVLYKTEGVDEAFLIALARPHLADSPEATPSATIPIDDVSRLRIVPVSGAWTAAYALFIERAGERGSLEAAAKKYALTPREVDVLRLIVAHRSSAQIASELYIAESTVADHVKSLFRKMKCNRRTELFAALYDG